MAHRGAVRQERAVFEDDCVRDRPTGDLKLSTEYRLQRRRGSEAIVRDDRVGG